MYGICISRNAQSPYDDHSSQYFIWSTPYNRLHPLLGVVIDTYIRFGKIEEGTVKYTVFFGFLYWMDEKNIEEEKLKESNYKEK